MDEKKLQGVMDEHAARRRELLKNAARLAYAAPAVAVLLTVGEVPAFAGTTSMGTTTFIFTTTAEPTPRPV